MKLEDGETLIGVHLCRDDQDLMLATRQGKCIRFEVQDVRIFAGRNSTGVRGIKLAEGDDVISVSVLNHADFSVEERNAYLKLSRQKRGLEAEESFEDDSIQDVALTNERYATLESQEQFILTVTSRGYGKRSSAFEYRITNRGGQGLANMELTSKNGTVVNSFVVSQDDHIMMVTDGGQMIRCPVNDVRTAGRKTQGVTLFRVPADENLVSVARIAGSATEDEEDALAEDTAEE
jgi:DNA gyrase subunit A